MSAADRSDQNWQMAAHPWPGPVEYKPGWRLRHYRWAVISQHDSDELASGRTVTRWGAERRRYRAYKRLLNADAAERKHAIETSPLLNRFRSWVNR